MEKRWFRRFRSLSDTITDFNGWLNRFKKYYFFTHFYRISMIRILSHKIIALLLCKVWATFGPFRRHRLLCSPIDMPSKELTLFSRGKGIGCVVLCVSVDPNNTPFFTSGRLITGTESRSKWWDNHNHIHCTVADALGFGLNANNTCANDTLTEEPVRSTPNRIERIRDGYCVWVRHLVHFVY